MITEEQRTAAIVEVRMPAEDREGTAAAIGKWLKRTGEAIEEHEPLLEINTDKVTMEIPAPAAGMLTECLKVEGDVVKPGELLGRIRTGLASPGTVEETSTAVPDLPDAIVAAEQKEVEGLSPGVRRLLREHSLRAEDVPKTSSASRLTIAEVEAFVRARGTASSPTANGTNPSPQQGRKVPHTPMRRAIAAHMTRSVQAAPHVTSVFEADLSSVLQHRQARKDLGEIPPSITAYLLRAACAAIRQFPEVNSRWHDDHLEIFDDINFGIGTALDTGGLVVPVIPNAHAMTLEQIGDALRSLTEKARAGRLTQPDMQGGTFTLSNHGVSGSLLAAPIILPHGQAAILGAGKLQKRVIVCETGGRELFRVRPMMYVTLTVDHRVLDGQQTNGFLTKFVAELENPLEH